VVSSMFRPHLTPGKEPVRILQELGRPQGRFGRAEKLAPTGIPYPDRPTHSQSPSRLSYPALHQQVRPGNISINNICCNNCFSLRCHQVTVTARAIQNTKRHTKRQCGTTSSTTCGRNGSLMRTSKPLHPTRRSTSQETDLHSPTTRGQN